MSGDHTKPRARVMDVRRAAKHNLDNMAEHSAAKVDRLGAIDGLRGLAVLAVILYHADIWGGGRLLPVLGIGRAGVDLFLVLSGFCLTWPLVRGRDSIKPLDHRQYWQRRTRRIYPPYLAALAVHILACVPVYLFAGRSWFTHGEAFQGTFPLRGTETAADLGLHLLLLHGLVPKFAHSFDGAFWSLSLEWQFYLLFPLLVVVARRSLWLAVATTFAVTIVWRVGLKLTYPAFLATWTGNEMCLSRWSEFGAGVAVAWLASRPPRNSRVLLALLAALTTVVAIAVEYRGLSGLLTTLAWSVALGSLVLLATRAGTLQRWLCAPPLIFIGERSYSLYLIHGTVYILLAIPASYAARSPNLREPLYLLVGVPLAILTAMGFFYLFERPFMASASAAPLKVRATAALEPAP